MFSASRMLRLAIAAMAFGGASAETALAMTCAASGYATAGGDLSSGQVTTLLSFNTACVGAAHVLPAAPWANQEYHSSGRLVEYGSGLGGADPSAQVGTYSIATGTPDVVTYSYASGYTVSYVVNGNTGVGANSVFDFCPVGGGSSVPVYILSGQVACTGASSPPPPP